MRLLAAVLVMGCGAREPSTAADAEVGADAATVDSATDTTMSDAAPDVVPVDAFDAAALPTCLGEARPIVVGANLPFVEVGVGSAKTAGLFLVDFATTASTIDLAAFSPRPAATGCDPSKLGQRCTFAEFDFFGSWGSVQLYTSDHGVIGGVREAGILGTDFLSVQTFTLDYASNRMFRAKKGAFCTDAELPGFRTLSTAGFYANDTSTLKPLSSVVAGASPGFTVPNVPTVPIRVAGAAAVAQLDTGFADTLVPFSLNVNAAYFDAIVAASPTALVRATSKDLVLTTCVSGVTEKVEAYTLSSDVSLELVTTASAVARSFPSTVVFVKRTPASAKSCGGIGTWTAPAAQLAASFFVDLGVVVFDPFGSRVLVR